MVEQAISFSRLGRGMGQYRWAPRLVHATGQHFASHPYGGPKCSKVCQCKDLSGATPMGCVMPMKGDSAVHDQWYQLRTAIPHGTHRSPTKRQWAAIINVHALQLTAPHQFIQSHPPIFTAWLTLVLNVLSILCLPGDKKLYNTALFGPRFVSIRYLGQGRRAAMFLMMLWICEPQFLRGCIEVFMSISNIYAVIGCR